MLIFVHFSLLFSRFQTYVFIYSLRIDAKIYTMCEYVKKKKNLLYFHIELWKLITNYIFLLLCKYII